MPSALPISEPPTPIATDAVVIGAGPIGLFLVFQLGLQGLRAHLIDTLPHPGGQCVELYGDKPIYDIPALPVCSAHELVQRLQEQMAPFAPVQHLGEQVSTLQPLATGGWQVGTEQGTQLHARAVFIAAGVGAFVPRTLKLPGLQAYSGGQVLYHLGDLAPLAGQRVVVHGGGEAAVAQAIACATAPAAQRPARTTLQHRRDVFDAPPELLQELQSLRAAGRMDVAIGMASGMEQEPAPPGLPGPPTRLTALTLNTPAGTLLRLPLDVLLVRLGLAPQLGPLADWGLQLERKQLRVDPATLATNLPGIYAVGDVAHYPGTRKLLVCGFHEATLAAFGAAEWLAGQALPLEYTSSSTRLQQRLGVQAATSTLSYS